MSRDDMVAEVTRLIDRAYEQGWQDGFHHRQESDGE